MRVIVLQVEGLDDLTEEQKAALDRETTGSFQDIVKRSGITGSVGVDVKILEGPQQKVRSKRRKKR